MSVASEGIQLQGAFTALVTPFNRDGTLDRGALKELVGRQIAAGISGLVPVGTTGESPTLSPQEHLQVIEIVVAESRGQLPVIAGSGSNSTAEALELTKQAAAVGADATLQVAPYYNKPNQEGLYNHYLRIADEGGLPVVIYNIPGRSAIALTTETITRLAAHPSIVAVKEASGGVQQTMALVEGCGRQLQILSGDDNLTLPIMALGGIGVISVASNVVPHEIQDMVQQALRGRWEPARQLHYKLLPLMQALFIDTNPIPLKCILALQGHIQEIYRLPLCPISDNGRVMLQEILHKMELL